MYIHTFNRESVNSIQKITLHELCAEYSHSTSYQTDRYFTDSCWLADAYPTTKPTVLQHWFKFTIS